MYTVMHTIKLDIRSERISAVCFCRWAYIVDEDPNVFKDYREDRHFPQSLASTYVQSVADTPRYGPFTLFALKDAAHEDVEPYPTAGDDPMGGGFGLGGTPTASGDGEGTRGDEAVEMNVETQHGDEGEQDKEVEHDELAQGREEEYDQGEGQGEEEEKEEGELDKEEEKHGDGSDEEEEEEDEEELMRAGNSSNVYHYVASVT